MLMNFLLARFSTVYNLFIFVYIPLAHIQLLP